MVEEEVDDPERGTLLTEVFSGFRRERLHTLSIVVFRPLLGPSPLQGMPHLPHHHISSSLQNRDDIFSSI